jgi:hypothetical protein
VSRKPNDEALCFRVDPAEAAVKHTVREVSYCELVLPTKDEEIPDYCLPGHNVYMVTTMGGKDARLEGISVHVLAFLSGSGSPFLSFPGWCKSCHNLRSSKCGDGPMMQAWKRQGCLLSKKH